ncbi:MAG: DUF4386 domain-containing protein [Flavobacteriaceae bacterium]
MQLTKKKGRIVGLLFLIIITLGATSLNFRGLNSTLLASETILLDVFEQATQMRLAIVLNLIAGLMWLGIAIFLFPCIKHISRSLAIWYVVLLVIQFGAALMGDIGHLSLINLSQQVQDIPVAEMTYYNTIGKVLVHEYFWGHFFSLMGYSSATFLLFIAFFRGKWVPRFIPVWGMAAMLFVFFASAVQLFDIKVSFWFYQQNGIHFIFMTLWLLVLGFRTTTIERPSLNA